MNSLANTLLKRRCWAAALLSAAALYATAQAQPKLLVKQPLGPQPRGVISTPAQTLPVIVDFNDLDRADGDEATPATSARPRAARRARWQSLQDEVLGRLDRNRLKRIKRFATVPAMALHVDLDTLHRLYQDPAVARVYEDRQALPSLVDSTPLIGAGPSQNVSGGAGQTVAILDTGVERGHLFFTDKIVDEACFSSSLNFSDASVSTLCPNGTESQIGPGAAAPCTLSDAGCDHGTHVAGIAAGRALAFGENAISGVAPDADLMAIQVFSRVERRSGQVSLSSFTSDQILALEHVFANRERFSVAAVNMSLGGGQFFGHCDDNSGPLLSIIRQLRAAGVVTVIASGNDGFDGSLSAPACLSSAVAVGSTTKSDQLSTFSNSASVVDLLAPGSDVLSAVLGGDNSLVARKNGTSMATPHVAGAFAVLRENFPAATADELETALKTTGVAVVRNGIAKPRIRVDRALAALAEAGPAVGVLDVSPSGGVSAAGPAGGPFTPASVVYTLRNGGATALDYRVSVDRPWVSLDSTGGLLGAGDRRDLTARIDAAALPPNSVDTATIVFRDLDNPVGDLSRRLSLTVTGASPPNDQLRNAVSLNGAGSTVNGSNVNASKEPGEPAHAQRSGGASVWWSFIADVDGVMTVDTRGSSFDTLLGVYTGAQVDRLSEIAGNDDEAAGVLSSAVEFPARAGTRYLIAVDGYQGRVGAVTLNWRLRADAAPSPVRLAVAPIETQMLSGVQGGPFAPVELRYTLSAIGGAAAFDVGGVPDWLSASQTAGSVDDGTSLELVFTVNGVAATLLPRRYDATLQFGDGVRRDVVLDVAPRAVFDHDDFADAKPLPGAAPVSDRSANAGASFQTREVLHADTIGGRSVWWTWTAPRDGLFLVDLDASNFDTLLGVYRGSGPTIAQIDDRLLSNDDAGAGRLHSRGLIDARAGVTYHLAVDGHNGSAGTIELSIRPAARSLANDDIAAATPLSGASGTVLAHNALATEQSGEPQNSLAIPGYHSLWWTLTTARAGTVTLDTFGSGFDTVLAVYRGDGPAALSEVAVNDDSNNDLQSQLSFEAEAGARYWVSVNGFIGATGPVVLNYQTADQDGEPGLLFGNDFEP